MLKLRAYMPVDVITRFNQMIVLVQRKSTVLGDFGSDSLTCPIVSTVLSYVLDCFRVL